MFCFTCQFCSLSQVEYQVWPEEQYVKGFLFHHCIKIQVIPFNWTTQNCSIGQVLYKTLIFLRLKEQVTLGQQDYPVTQWSAVVVTGCSSTNHKDFVRIYAAKYWWKTVYISLVSQGILLPSKHYKTKPWRTKVTKRYFSIDVWQSRICCHLCHILL